MRLLGRRQIRKCGAGRFPGEILSGGRIRYEAVRNKRRMNGNSVFKYASAADIEELIEAAA